MPRPRFFIPTAILPLALGACLGAAGSGDGSMVTRSRPPQDNAALLAALQAGPDLGLLDEPPERLRQFRLFLIQTSLGRLDVLRDVDPIGDYHAIERVDVTVSGMQILIIARKQLITVKRAVGRPKDRDVALELELAEEAERERK